jgi:ribosomal protein S18 acetylase RimI-like enzyme
MVKTATYAKPETDSDNLIQRKRKSKMTDINIQKVSIDNIDQLQKIGRQTFFETFATGNTEENMIKYLDEGFSITKLTTELNDNNAEFYFAIHNNHVIGYLKLNFGQSQTELQDDRALEIERIYVLKEFHGKSVGQLLYDKAKQIARQKGADYVWLGVWEENPRAINFYRKNGFTEFDKHVFKLGNDEQTDIMMKLKLND